MFLQLELVVIYEQRMDQCYLAQIDNFIQWCFPLSLGVFQLELSEEKVEALVESTTVVTSIEYHLIIFQ